MKLTPAQYRYALDISQETLRHWRRSLPVFQGRKGYAPAFTSGDLVVGAVIKLLRERWGISVNAFAEQSTALGKAVERTSWPSLAASTLRLSLTSEECELVPTTSRQTVDTPCLIVPLGPIIEHLTAVLVDDENQGRIYFPPVPIGNKAQTS